MLRSCVNVVFELPMLLLLEVGIVFAVDMIVIEVLVALMPVVVVLATVALPASVALGATEDEIVIFPNSVALTMLKLAPIVTEVTLGAETVTFSITFTVGIVIFVATPVELFVEDVLEVAIVVLVLATVALPASVTFVEITDPVELVKVTLGATEDVIVKFPTSVALTRGGITPVALTKLELAPIVTEVTLKADAVTFSVTLTVALRIVIDALPVVSLVGIATTVE
jgi:hypothetical protein